MEISIVCQDENESAILWLIEKMERQKISIIETGLRRY